MTRRLSLHSYLNPRKTDRVLSILKYSGHACSMPPNNWKFVVGHIHWLTQKTKVF